MIESLEIASDRYKDVKVAISRVGGILHNRRKEIEEPGYKQASMAFSVLRSRFKSCNTRKFWLIVNEARSNDIDPDYLLELSKTCRSESAFYGIVEDFNRHA